MKGVHASEWLSGLNLFSFLGLWACLILPSNKKS